MCTSYVAVKAIHWGGGPQVRRRSELRALASLLVMLQKARADPVTATVPDAPVAPQPIVVAPAAHRPSWDLDGTYLWLGPIGAASFLAHWDSTFGGAGGVAPLH